MRQAFHQNMQTFLFQENTRYITTYNKASTQISRSPHNKNSSLPKNKAPSTYSSLPPQALQTHAANYTLPMYNVQKGIAETIVENLPSRPEPQSNDSVVVRSCL